MRLAEVVLGCLRSKLIRQQGVAMAGTPTDQRHHEPTLDELSREFCTWECWKGVNNLYYARLPRTSPPVVVCGEDTLDLRDQIIKVIWNRDNGSKVCDPVNDVCVHTESGME